MKKKKIIYNPEKIHIISTASPNRDLSPPQGRLTGFKIRNDIPKIVHCDIEATKSIRARDELVSFSDKIFAVNKEPVDVQQVDADDELVFAQKAVDHQVKAPDFIPVKPESELNIRVGGDNDFEPFEIAEDSFNENVRNAGKNVELYKLPNKYLNTSENIERTELVDSFVDKIQKKEDYSFVQGTLIFYILFSVC